MTIRKFGTEPAKTEVKPEDNDSETLNRLRNLAKVDWNREPPRTDDDEQPKTAA